VATAGSMVVRNRESILVVSHLLNFSKPERDDALGRH
jgi:hypothetical protein